MAYQYNFFSKQLIGNNSIDLSQVFPDQQSMARQATNVAYGLGDIVLYLQDVTQDFKRAERPYIDLDNAIQSIVFKYYKSKDIANPFKANVEPIKQVDNGPREAVIIKEGKTKRKSKIFKKDEDIEKVFDVNDLEELKANISFNEQSPDDDTMQIISDDIKKIFGSDDKMAKKWFKDNGFDYDKYNV